MMINKFIDMVKVYSVVVSNDEFEYLEFNIDIIEIIYVKSDKDLFFMRYLQFMLYIYYKIYYI